MVIQINISNRAIYTFLAIVIIILLGVGVYAAIPNPGHGDSEIEVTNTLCNIVTGHDCGSDTDTNTWPNCPNGQVWSGGACVANYDGYAADTDTDTNTWPNCPNGQVWSGGACVANYDGYAADTDTDTNTYCTVTSYYESSYCSTCFKITCPDGTSVSRLSCTEGCNYR